MKTALIVVQFALLIWFGQAIARLENQRYAYDLGMCGNFVLEGKALVDRDRCINSINTRTSDFYNLAYGLRLL
jgi:hypothetical protein